MRHLETPPRRLDRRFIVGRRQLRIEGCGELGKSAAGDVCPRLFSIDPHTVTLSSSGQANADEPYGCGRVRLQGRVVENVQQRGVTVTEIMPGPT